MRRLGLLLLVAILVVSGCSSGPVGGLEWDRVDDPAFGERILSEGGDRLSILSVASNGSVLLAVGSDGGIFSEAAVWVSADGRDWHRADVPAPNDEGSIEQMEGVAAIGQAFVAHGWTPHIHDSVLWFSPDGSTWTRLPALVLGDPTEESEIEALVAAGPGLVAVGSAWHPTSAEGSARYRYRRPDEIGQESATTMMLSAGGEAWRR